MTRIDDLHVTVFEAGSGMPRVGKGTLVPGRLEVVLHDGQTIGFDLARVALSLGGASGTMIYLRDTEHGATATVDTPGFREQLRAAGGGSLDAVLDSFQAKGKRRLHWDRVMLVLVLLLSAGFLGFVLMLPDLLESAVAKVPHSVDRSIGDAMIENVAPQAGLTHDPLLEDSVRTILARLEPHVSHDGFVYRVRVLASPDVNAFALPGGQIVVCAGLIARADRPEVVAGVLAHELAHVTERHAIKDMISKLGLSFGVRLLLGEIDFLPAYAQDGALLAAMRGFSRAEETEADAVGYQTLLAAGVDPNGLVDVFRELARTPGTEMPGMLAWMSTHPEHGDRITALERRLRESPPGATTPIAIDEWAAVRAAADRAIAAHPLAP